MKTRIAITVIAALITGALFTSCSGGSGGSTVNPVAPDTPAAITSITVQPGTARISVGNTQVFTAEARDSGGTVVQGTVFTWMSSNSSATVTAGIARGIAAGSADITATAAGVTSNSVRLTVDPPSSAVATSDALIDAALQSGTIDEETAFVFRVFAFYDDPRLPVEYRGLDQEELDSSLLLKLTKRFTTLSSSARETLRPFLIPPIYQGSWGDPGLSAPSYAASSTDGFPRHAAMGFVDTACGVTALQQVAGWARKTTAHFSIWYPTKDFPPYNNDFYTPAQAEQAAANLAAAAEFVYQKITTVMGRTPFSDVNEVCNGGDGLFDIYVARFSRRATALTVAYPPGCTERPAWMWIAADEALDANRAQAILAHEFMHTIDFAIPKGTDCEDYTWLGEASGNWAIDYVYPDNQYEQSFSRYYLGFGVPEYNFPIDESNHMLVNYNGYDDYMFLFFLSHQYGPSIIKSIWDSTPVFDSVTALNAGTLELGGLHKVWPEFAAANWNDWDGGNQDAYYRWDALQEGRKLYQQPEDVALAAYQQRREVLLNGDIDYAVPRLGAQYEDYTFTDPNLRWIAFTNPSALIGQMNFLYGPNPDFMIQALLKINGEWQAPQDWTNLSYRSYCRDLKAERLEELVLVYSNADKERPANSVVITPPRMTLSVSNVGCARWDGTATSTATSSSGGNVLTQTWSASVTFGRQLIPGAPAVPGREFFSTVTGTANWSIAGVDAAGCSHSGSGTGPVQADDGQIQLNVLDVAPELSDRISYASVPQDRLYFGTGQTPLTVTHTITCAGASNTVTGQDLSMWLTMPPDGLKISDDGRTMEGTWIEPNPVGDMTHRWQLNAVSEP